MGMHVKHFQECMIFSQDLKTNTDFAETFLTEANSRIKGHIQKAVLALIVVIANLY